MQYPNTVHFLCCNMSLYVHHLTPRRHHTLTHTETDSVSRRGCMQVLCGQTTTTRYDWTDKRESLLAWHDHGRSDSSIEVDGMYQEASTCIQPPPMPLSLHDSTTPQSRSPRHTCASLKLTHNDTARPHHVHVGVMGTVQHIVPALPSSALEC